MKTLKLTVSFFLISSTAFAGEGDGSGAESNKTYESSLHCHRVQFPSINKGEGDGSSMQPKYIVVCKEIKKTQ